MTTANPLCAHCLEIPLEKCYNDEKWFETQFSLGSPSRIHSSDCPLCRLVSKALIRFKKSSAVDRLDDRDKSITLAWDYILHMEVPGLRPAFTVLAGALPVRRGCLAFGDALYIPSKKGKEKEYGRSSCLLPRLFPELNVGRVLRWVDSCTAKHDCLLQPHLEPLSRVFPGLEVLRLIDVVQCCLVETREPAEYIVLSYVWGSVANFRLTKANRLNLMLPGALQKVDHLLPKTIHDAITLVRRLGIRYLWVDSICLLQNDPEDLKRGVQLAVIATYGHDANAGLPGIDTNLRESQALLYEIKPGINMGLLMDPDIRLMGSLYETRAWTFQEHFLSRRKLYFFEDEVTFRCRHCECLESCRDVADPKLRIRNTSSPLWYWYSTTFDSPVFKYRAMLEHYTQRTLTDQSDALRAMAGIMRRFLVRFRYRPGMLEGMPTGAFDYFIISLAATFDVARGFQAIHGQILPHIEGDVANDWLRDRTWIIWYNRSPGGVLGLVWDPEANPAFNTLDEKLEGYRRRSQFRCPQPLAIDTTRTVPAEEAPSLNRPPPSYPILQFYTMVVYLRFGDWDVFKPQAKLIGRNGAVNDHVILDGFEGTTFFESNGPFELVLLSEADGWPEVYFPRGDWEYYKVMLIEWEGGLVERRGIGAIKKKPSTRASSVVRSGRKLYLDRTSTAYGQVTEPLAKTYPTSSTELVTFHPRRILAPVSNSPFNKTKQNTTIDRAELSRLPPYKARAGDSKTP
ncbi:hypothetical protein V8F06_012424 [Rhypophila decipiens]